MTLHASTNPELDSLLEDLLEDRLTADRAARLNFLLKTDPFARDRYLLYMELHGALLYDHVSVASLEDGLESAQVGLGDTMILPALKCISDQDMDSEILVAPPFELRPEPSPAFVTRYAWWISIAAMVLIGIGTTWFLLTRPARPTLVASIDATWQPAPEMPHLGKTMPRGEVQLNTGLARIKFATGTEIVVEAPARLKADAINGVSLLSGKLTAVVPPEGHGFTVKCPDATIVDLGTEFGINLHSNGLTDVDVFRGTVTLAPQSADEAGNTAAVPPVALTAGTARQVAPDHTIVPIAYNAAAYVRTQDFDQLASGSASASASFARWRVYSDTLRDDPDLVAYYTFERPEDAPNRLANQSAYGSSLDGSLASSGSDGLPAWESGRWPNKGALKFDPKTTQHVALPDSPDIDFSRSGKPSAPFTICAWIQPSKSGLASGAIICRGHGAYEQYAIDFPPPGLVGGELRAWVRGLTDPKQRPSVLLAKIRDLTAWHLVTSVYDPAKVSLRLFVDGQLISERQPSLELLSVGEVNIGSRQDLSNRFDSTFTGSIDELAIFKRPLTADEISQMYNAGRPD